MVGLRFVHRLRQRHWQYLSEHLLQQRNLQVGRLPYAAHLFHPRDALAEHLGLLEHLKALLRRLDLRWHAMEVYGEHLHRWLRRPLVPTHVTPEQPVEEGEERRALPPQLEVVERDEDGVVLALELRLLFEGLAHLNNEDRREIRVQANS